MIELIEAYLEGELSVREKIDFEEHLKNDPELMKEFVLRRAINEAISESDILDLRNTLSEISLPETKAKKLHRNPFVLSSVAAAVIVLFVISWSAFFAGNEVSSSEVFNTYYSKYPVLTCNRSLSESNENLKDKTLVNAFDAYEKEFYIEAKDYFNQVLIMDYSNNMARFYASICEIELNNLKKSEKLLKDLLYKNNHIFWEQAHWYLALVYIKQEKFDKATELLNQIIENEMVHKSESKKILKSLH
ncbi:MAG: zf-HC2 domain-containing protein [Bacteroidales bacterium]|nr:zf-HC2 domain-containing protein [Bacteroidales bacterium]